MDFSYVKVGMPNRTLEDFVERVRAAFVVCTEVSIFDGLAKNDDTFHEIAEKILTSPFSSNRTSTTARLYGSYWSTRCVGC